MLTGHLALTLTLTLILTLSLTLTGNDLVCNKDVLTAYRPKHVFNV